jgi:hypothetical protein
LNITPATLPLYLAKSSSPSAKASVTGHIIGRPFSRYFKSSRLHSKILRFGIPISIGLIDKPKSSVD